MIFTLYGCHAVQDTPMMNRLFFLCAAQPVDCCLARAKDRQEESRERGGGPAVGARPRVLVL